MVKILAWITGKYVASNDSGGACEMNEIETECPRCGTRMPLDMYNSGACPECGNAYFWLMDEGPGCEGVAALHWEEG